ncbi:hypothetical protein ACHAAC_06015 [Aeromicrobium sp. CF4.19]|uniref:hypothetical protein n=1 Tax=Aeromicrobium sp. CF4.19 TaxID=3373082 RepID=UPI003EE719CA
MLGTRGLRALAASLVAALCASGGHLLAGGELAATVPLVVALLSWPVAFVAAGRRLTTGQLLGLLVLGQGVAHALAGHAPSAGWTMLFAHVGATAVSMVVLRRGEDAWWRVAEALQVLLARLLPVREVALPHASMVHAVPEGWIPLRALRAPGTRERAPPVGS